MEWEVDSELCAHFVPGVGLEGVLLSPRNWRLITPPQALDSRTILKLMFEAGFKVNRGTLLHALNTAEQHSFMQPYCKDIL